MTFRCGGKREIPLTQGKVAIVSECDFDELIKFKWYYAKGYARRMTRNGSGQQRVLFMHNAIMGRKPGFQVDHINTNKLDNRRENLRFCTPSQNNMNKPKRRNAQISKYKGVNYYPDRKIRKFQAVIKKDKKDHSLGYYETEKEAAEAYNNAAIKMFGDFANLNRIED